MICTFQLDDSGDRLLETLALPFRPTMTYANADEEP
jgi:hypothetical protein